MTTPEAAQRYLGEHMTQWNGRPYAIHNPNDRPLEDLPVIYGFNNGGNRGWGYTGVLLAEDGTGLGGHLCSDEGYMRHDLGILEDSRPDRHEQFRAHYPDGYRMEFVRLEDVKDHEGLDEAYRRNQELAAQSEEAAS